MITVLFDHRLPALSFIAVRSQITAHQPMCHLAAFDNQIDGAKLPSECLLKDFGEAFLAPWNPRGIVYPEDFLRVPN